MVDYTLSDIVFSHLVIPTKGVTVDFKEHISIEVADITAQINNMSWKFRQQSFPHVKDNGTADAKVDEAKGSFAFSIVFENGKPKLIVTKLDFSMEQLELKVRGASVNRLYNWVLSVFSESIRQTVQKKLVDFLNQHIGKVTEKLNSLVLTYWPQVGRQSEEPNMLVEAENSSDPSDAETDSDFPADA